MENHEATHHHLFCRLFYLWCLPPIPHPPTHPHAHHTHPFLQARHVTVTFLSTLFSVVVLTTVQFQSCWSYLDSILGVAPVQVCWTRRRRTLGMQLGMREAAVGGGDGKRRQACDACGACVAHPRLTPRTVWNSWLWSCTAAAKYLSPVP